MEFSVHTAVAYVSGTLEGTWNDNSNFEGIRFIYRFDIRSGKVAETRLWSDVAEVLRRSGKK